MFGMFATLDLHCLLLDASQPEFTSLRQKEERRCGAEESEVDHWNLVSEECKYKKTSKLPCDFT